VICTVHRILFGMIRSGRVRWAVHKARMRGKRTAYRYLVGKPDGKVPHRGRRPTCEDNIKMDRKTGGIGERGMHLCDSELAKVTSNLANFLSTPCDTVCPGRWLVFCWFRVIGKLRGSPNGAVICFKNACVVQRQVVKQT